MSQQDEITALIERMSLATLPQPPRIYYSETKRYAAVPPPASIPGKRRARRIRPTQYEAAKTATSPPLKPSTQNQAQQPQNANTSATVTSPKGLRPIKMEPPKPLPPGASHQSPAPHTTSLLKVNTPKFRSPNPSKSESHIQSQPFFSNACDSHSTTTPTPPGNEPQKLFLIIWEPFNYVGSADKLIGIFSNLDEVTKAVEGLGAGPPRGVVCNGYREFGCGEGKVKALPQELKQGCASVVMALEDEEEKDHGRDRSEEQELKSIMEGEEGAGLRKVYLALDTAAGGRLFCIGVFTTQTSAWAACSKYRVQLSYCSTAQLVGKEEWIDEKGMRHARGRIDGGGWHHWFVRVVEVDRVLGRRHRDRVEA